MHLNPCKSNWELCLKEGLGVIGMQNKHVALETHGVFLPRPLQWNICRFRQGLNSVPRHSHCQGPVGSWAVLWEGDWEGTILLPRGSQPLRGIEQRPEACLHPILIILILGLKNRWWGCFSQSSVFGLHSPTCPAPHQGNYWGFLPPWERAFFTLDPRATPLNIPGSKGECFSEGFGKGPLPPGPQHGRQGAGAVWEQSHPTAAGAPRAFGVQLHQKMPVPKRERLWPILIQGEFGFSKIGRRRGNIHWVKKSIPFPPLPDTEKKIKTQAVFFKNTIK